LFVGTDARMAQFTQAQHCILTMEYLIDWPWLGFAATSQSGNAKKRFVTYIFEESGTTGTT